MTLNSRVLRYVKRCHCLNSGFAACCLLSAFLQHSIEPIVAGAMFQKAGLQPGLKVLASGSKVLSFSKPL